MIRHVVLLLLCTLLAATITSAQSTRIVAVTFDDLPFTGGSLADAELGTAEMLEALASYDASADLFVIGNLVEIDGEVEARRNLLRRWRDAGHRLHNHSYTHPRYNTLPPAGYLTDVERGEAIVRSLRDEISLRGNAPYYRAPYNDLGGSAEKRDTLVAALGRHGVRLAPFTIEHSDYIFNAVYRHALSKGDTTLAERVGEAYLAQLDSAFEFAERLSTEMFGREISQVFLIHANRINSRYLGTMLSRISRRGYRFVSLEEAAQDSAYATPNMYARQFGVSWLHRWRVALQLPDITRNEPGVPDWVFKAYQDLQKR